MKPIHHLQVNTNLFKMTDDHKVYMGLKGIVGLNGFTKKSRI
jgi:hypothetical protein